VNISGAAGDARENQGIRTFVIKVVDSTAKVNGLLMINMGMGQTGSD